MLRLRLNPRLDLWSSRRRSSSRLWMRLIPSRSGWGLIYLMAAFRGARVIPEF